MSNASLRVDPVLANAIMQKALREVQDDRLGNSPSLGGISYAPTGRGDINPSLGAGDTSGREREVKSCPKMSAQLV